MTNVEIYNLLLALLMAVASGLVGSFALMRRMTLAGDAISHIALPGLSLAILYSLSPLIGAGVALILGAIIIWKIEETSKLNTEAVTGVLFALSLAIGALLVEEEHELIKLLFGSTGGVTLGDFIAGTLISILIVLFILKNRYSLTLSLVSKELAKTVGVNNDRLQLLFLLVFSLTVLLGLKFLGVLLMGSLIIIPAATARNVAVNLNTMLSTAVMAALIAIVLGILIVQLFELPLGPSIVGVASALFFLTLIFRRGRD